MSKSSVPVVKAVLSECQCYANCVAAAEDRFDISDDGVVQADAHLTDYAINKIPQSQHPAGLCYPAPEDLRVY